MLQFFDTLTDDSGNALLGATVQVTQYPSGAAATIYLTNGTSQPIANNTVSADITGQVSFFIPDGSYILTYSYKGTQYKVRSPVQMIDPTGFVAVADAGGAANTYVVNSQTLSAQLYSGMKVEVLAAHTNTGNSTLNINGTGAVPINQPGGSGLAAGMVQANGLIRVEYDGTQWQLIGSQSQPFYAVTTAENNAGVNPIALGGSLAFVPGDMRRYGASPASDVTAAWNAAIQQAIQAGGSPVYVPGALGLNCTITAGVTITAPVQIYGDGYQVSKIGTAGDITFLTLNGATAANSRIRQVQFAGKGQGLSPTLPGVKLINANQVQFDSVYIHDFAYGIYFARGANSCYLCSIADSFITTNATCSIFAEAQTNALYMDNVTFGAAPTGLSIVDSQNLVISGGDCEGCTVAAVDIDSTGNVFPQTSFGAHSLLGLHLEGNTTTGGDVRIGKTAPVFGVHIVGTIFGPNGTAGAINAVNCNGLFVRGTMSSSAPFLKKTNLSYEDIDVMNVTGNVPAYRIRNYKCHLGDEAAVTQRSAAFFDGNYQDSGAYSQFQIQPSSTVANGSYYNEMDTIELANAAGSTASNVRLYARFFFGINSKGDGTKCGAWRAFGDIDHESGTASYSQSASAQVIATSGTITVTTVVCRVAPAAAVTGVILQAGTHAGQKAIVLNESTGASSITFAAAGTSNVADGTSDVIAGLTAREYTWDSSTALWYRHG